MWVIGPVGFTAPWLLAGLLGLPLLWWLLRAVPPAPLRRRFPGVMLLLGLRDENAEADKTPWWLLLLRLLALAALIIGFAGPVLHPQAARPGSGPVLIVLDGTWADAADWPQRMQRVTALLGDAARAQRAVAVAVLTDPPAAGLLFQPAESAQARVPGLRPKAWQPDAGALGAWAAVLPGGRFETYWLSDGLARDGRPALLAALEAHGPVTVYQSPRPVFALRPAQFAETGIVLEVLRLPATAEGMQLDLAAFGLDPNGLEQELARAPAVFPAGSGTAQVMFALPPEVRNRITRFELPGQRSAGAVSLTDDSLHRRKVALVAGRAAPEGLELLSPLHYLRGALAPVADLVQGSLADALLASPDVIVLADVARLPAAQHGALLEWVENGGLLLRFAGPRLAALGDESAVQDALMPVRLRAGGRAVGGAMSWGDPKTLRPFAEGSPFFGLPVPEEVRVRAQVMAQPDPDLAARTIAALSDGTPLVTRRAAGLGQVVLFHVTANAEWSSLPLSGLFVQMLERLLQGAGASPAGAGDLAGTVWQLEKQLDAFGVLKDAPPLPGIAGEVLAQAMPGPAVPPGLYTGADRRVALNVIGAQTPFEAAPWPAHIALEGAQIVPERLLKGAFLAGGLLLLLADALAALWLSGRLRGLPVGAVLALVLLLPPGMGAANEDFALHATADVALAHVLTGDAEVDRTAEAGLRGLSLGLAQRTSVEPAAPVGIDLERDELSFFPFLYWPVTADQPLPSAAAYERLNQYLRSGGMILFDTRDGDIAGSGGATPAGGRLQALALALDIPPLEAMPADHVLTRTFYLLQDFPGRHTARGIWVEAAPPGAEQAEGMPFRNLNDGVTPVVIGGNDWAAAWAVDGRGLPLFAVGRGFAGERQREIALRFGINLIMHVLTGNYKSDQVHVPALLDRLGQ